MPRRLRSVLVRPGRERLSGMVDVDETSPVARSRGYAGQHRPRTSGEVDASTAKRCSSPIAVEVLEPKGLGRCHIEPLADCSAESLLPFLTDHVEPGAIVTTDSWSGCNGLTKPGYLHHQLSQRATRDPATRATGRRHGPTARRAPSPPCSSADCWTPTKARSSRRTFPPTSTSTSSGPTARPRIATACCSCANYGLGAPRPGSTLDSPKRI